MKKIKHLIEKYKYHESAKLLFPFFVSGFAEIVCMAFYLPIDVIRTRVQVSDHLCIVELAWFQIYISCFQFEGNRSKGRNRQILQIH